MGRDKIWCISIVTGSSQSTGFLKLFRTGNIEVVKDSSIACNIDSMLRFEFLRSFSI